MMDQGLLICKKEETVDEDSGCLGVHTSFGCLGYSG